ncbi:MAG: hypothetical protein Kow0042_16170 [Calditrichia bacterium]
MKIFVFLIVTLSSGLFLTPGFSASWQTATSFHTPRVGASAVEFNQKIYLMGGKTTGNNILNTVEVYDPQTGLWDETTVPDFNYARYNAAAVVFQGKIFLIGGSDGYNALDEVEVFDPVQNSWSEVHKLRKKRTGLSAVVFNNRIYVMGGIEYQYYYVEEIEWYDFLNDEWEKSIANLPQPRAAAFVAAYDEWLYFCGGEYFGAANDGFIADTTFTWTPGIMLQTGRHYGGMAEVHHNLYMIGGETGSGVSNLVEIFNPYSGQIYPGVPLPLARSGIATAVLNDTIYVMGGWSVNHFQILDLVQYFAPDPVGIDDHWKTVSAPRDYLLIQGYPNPFNGRVRFRVQVPRADNYRVSVYNLTGQEVAHLFSGYLSAGNHEYVWEAKTDSGDGVASGIYIAAIKNSSQKAQFKVIYVR